MIPAKEQLTTKSAGELAGGFSASSVTRWIEQGAPLRCGGRLRLRAERYPAGWRTCEVWVREFVAALTADRAGAASSKTPEEGAPSGCGAGGERVVI